VLGRGVTHSGMIATVSIMTLLAKESVSSGMTGGSR
jgi:hypothetical protein